MVRPVLKKFKTVLDPRRQGGATHFNFATECHMRCQPHKIGSTICKLRQIPEKIPFPSTKFNRPPPIYVSQLIQMWKGNILDDSFFRNFSLPRQNLILVLHKRKMRRSFKVTFKQIQKHKWQGRKDMKQEQSTAKTPAGLLFCTFLMCLFLRQSPNLGQQVTIFCTLLKQPPRLILHAYISL